jgi:NAD(P)-dependent dehydrogenase (short-subunit alcohol dehydrogenase family)
MASVIWVTGGGSGIGRAIALAAAAEGWDVAISGRTAQRLTGVASEAAGLGARSLAVPLDVADHESVAAAERAIQDRFGRLDAVVHAAGANTPRRRWADQSMSEFDDILGVNLRGAAAVIDAALPALRGTGGQVVLIASQSAWTFNRGAGVAYSASKAGLSALCRTLNDQENQHGIKACCLHPGDVSTDFLLHRPVVPDEEARARMLSPDDVARAVLFVLGSPKHVRVDELVMTPIYQV